MSGLRLKAKKAYCGIEMGYQGFVVVVLLFLFFPSHILGKERVNSFYSTIELNISRELCLVFCMMNCYIIKNVPEELSYFLAYFRTSKTEPCFSMSRFNISCAGNVSELLTLSL